MFVHESKDGNGFLEFSTWFTKHIEERLAPYARFQPCAVSLDPLVPRIHETYLACADAYANQLVFRLSDWKKNIHFLLEETNGFLSEIFLQKAVKIAVLPDFLSSENEILTMLEKTIKNKFKQN